MDAITKVFFPIVTAILIAGCGEAPNTATAEATNTLIPFQTSTHTPTLLSTQGTVTPIHTPVPSSTPFTHIVSEGETLLGIALRYGVEMEDLLISNPGVDSRFLSIGQELVIPGPEGEPISQLAPTATPVPLTFSQSRCDDIPSGVLWCVVTVTNTNPFQVENIGATFNLYDSARQLLVSKNAYAPLNSLPSGRSLPLTVMLPDPPAEYEEVRVTSLSAIGVPENNSRFLSVPVEIRSQQPLSGGRTWLVEVELREVDEIPLENIVIVIIGYDAEDRVVGYRKVTGPDSQIIEVSLLSTGLVIDRIEVLAEGKMAAE